MKPLSIYLDQCAASTIAKNPDWNELRDLLVGCAEAGNAYCPLPFDTILETSRCERTETRKAIFDLFKDVSGGWIFRQFFDILADELLHLVRPAHQFSGFDHTFETNRLCALSAEIGPAFDEERNDRNSILKSWTNQPKPLGITFNQILKDVAREPVALLWRDLRLIATSQDIRSPLNLECPKITERLLKNRLTTAEATELAEKLRHHKMSAIPIQFFHNRLAAAASQTLLQRTQAVFDYNDIIDQERMSVALAFADYAITDRSMAARIEQSGVYNVSTCKVFRVGDLRRFEKTLIEEISSRKSSHQS